MRNRQHRSMALPPRVPTGFVGGRGHGRGSGRARDIIPRIVFGPRLEPTNGSRGGSRAPTVANITYAIQQMNVVDPEPAPSAAFVALDGERLEILGLELAGFEIKRQGSKATKTRRFRAHFGVGSAAIASMYNDLREKNVRSDRLLMAMNFLKGYDTEHVLSGRWKMDEREIRESNRIVLREIQGLKEKKVVWGDWEEDEIFIGSVDGVNCRIQEVRKDPGSKWFDYKSHGAGVGYELGISIRSGNLIWIRGPFTASTHDVTKLRGEEEHAPLLGPPPPAQCLKDKIEGNQRFVGDAGYRGEPTKISITRPDDSDEVKHFKARVKSRHETFNARIKSFLVLAMPFRHDISQHKQCFESVCLAVQYDIENGHPLFQV